MVRDCPNGSDFTSVPFAEVIIVRVEVVPHDLHEFDSDTVDRLDRRNLEFANRITRFRDEATWIVNVGDSYRRCGGKIDLAHGIFSRANRKAFGNRKNPDTESTKGEIEDPIQFNEKKPK